MLSREEYTNYCSRFKKVYNYLLSKSIPKQKVALDICKLRGYDPERMLGVLTKAGFLFIEDNDVYKNLENAGSDLGLFKDGSFLLKERYIFPVYDMMGNVVALIGWFPDDKKYITTPSKLFSKSCLFYGLEQMGKTGIGKEYFLVEGIFDSLSVRSLGFNCVAQMGINSSRYKQVLYGLFKQLIAIPDNDSQGREVVYKDKWLLPQNGKYVKWKNTPLKDIDDIVHTYSEEDMVELLNEIRNEKSRIVEIEL